MNKLGLKSKIIAPPATLTSEMGRNLSSAKSEVHMVSLTSLKIRIRQSIPIFRGCYLYT